MDEPAILLEQASGDAVDLICRACGGSDRLHPDEAFVEQVRLFLEQHRHPVRSRSRSRS